MWLWRAGRQKRWVTSAPPTPEQLEEAARDLALRDEEGLSVFQVADPENAERVAVFFGMTARDKPGPVDYILIPQDCFAALPEVQLVPVPANDLPPFLSDCHHEVRGLTDSLSLKLATLILNHPNHRICRLSKSTLLQLATALLRHEPSVHNYLKGEWLTILQVDSK